MPKIQEEKKNFKNKTVAANPLGRQHIKQSSESDTILLLWWISSDLYTKAFYPYKVRKKKKLEGEVGVTWNNLNK